MSMLFDQVVATKDEVNRLASKGIRAMTHEELLREQEERKRQEEAPARRGVALFARIRPSSKYFGQTKPGELFPVYVQPNTDYTFGGGPGGQYRKRDVDLFAKLKNGDFVQLTEQAPQEGNQK